VFQGLADIIPQQQVLTALPTVEIKQHFYQMPKTAMLENWAATTPKEFRFASRRPPHYALARLKGDEAKGRSNTCTSSSRRSAPSAGRCVPAAAVPEEGHGAARAFLEMLPKIIGRVRIRNDSCSTTRCTRR